MNAVERAQAELLRKPLTDEFWQWTENERGRPRMLSKLENKRYHKSVGGKQHDDAAVWNGRSEGNKNSQEEEDEEHGGDVGNRELSNKEEDTQDAGDNEIEGGSEAESNGEGDFEVDVEGDFEGEGDAEGEDDAEGEGNADNPDEDEPEDEEDDEEDDEESEENEDEPADQHEEYGPCPFGHTDRSLGPDCRCPCNSCRNIRTRPENYDFHRGYYRRPMRVIHANPPSPDPTARQRCTEMTPWNTNVENWIEQCEHSRVWPPRPGTRVYRKGIRKCCEAEALGHNCAYPRDDEIEQGFLDAFDLQQDPPGDPDNKLTIRFVCQDHIDDSKRFWELEKLYKAHLVGTCRDCRKRFKDRYRHGLNTCTCTRLFDRWQCRRCFERKVFKAQNHFRRRVLASHAGGGVQHEGEAGYKGKAENNGFILRRDYHLSWRRVRAIVARNHPCSHRCGKERILRNEDVMDCRSCGGTIVQAPRQYSLRSERTPLLELDQRGRPRPVRGLPAAAQNLQPAVPTYARASDEDGTDDGDEFSDFWTETHSEYSARNFEVFMEESRKFKDGGQE